MRHVRVWLAIFLFAALYTISAEASTQPKKILLLGDSITHGASYAPGYRPYLWDMLNDAGYNVDFVGSMSRHTYMSCQTQAAT